ncbi:MAG TPA: hypothetical protein VK623_04290 [Flavobacterium sp.]|nr:hypothetical protein [Flavobacterium sp.]
MKKLIAVLTLFLAFTIGANAQESKVGNSNAEVARQDAIKLNAIVGLTDTQQDNFTSLFLMKYNTLSNPDLSNDRKKEMSRIVEMKIRASLTAEQLQKLDAKPTVLAELTGANTLTPEKAKK